MQQPIILETQNAPNPEDPNNDPIKKNKEKVLPGMPHETPVGHPEQSPGENS